MNRRTKLVAIIAAVAVGSTAVGWVAGQRIKSPADIAAETAPPVPSLITVPVERRVLSSTVITRGTVGFDEQSEIRVSASSAGDSTPIVTRLPLAAGASLLEGDVIVEVSGRPVIALAGELPVFRNLTPGLEGPDVAQLEAALIRLGHDPGEPDGVYSPDTEAAVDALYRELGYAPVGPTFDATAALEAAQDRVRGAQESLRIAQDAVAESPTATSTRLQLDRAVAAAEQELSIATATATLARTEAAAAVAAARNRFAIEPTAENAEALRSAEANEIIANREQDLSVGNALAGVEIARALRVEGLDANDGEGARRQLDDARRELSDAQADLERLDDQIGIAVPAAELVFLPTLPRTVQSVPAKPGDGIDEAIMTISGSGVIIDSAVSANDRPLLTIGLEATIEDETLGISVPAVITSIADGPGEGGRYTMRLEPLAELPEEAVGQSLRISIPIESTGGEVLAVPLAALSAGPDGSARVERAVDDDETRLVPVTTGLRAEGYVEITGELTEGDRVVVGRQ